MDDFPIPLVPIGAIGARSFTRPTIFLINFSCPKQALGGGGGDSPGGMLDANVRLWILLTVIEAADLGLVLL